MLFPTTIKYLVLQFKIGSFLKLYPFYFESRNSTKITVKRHTKSLRRLAKILGILSSMGAIVGILLFLLVPIVFANLSIKETVILVIAETITLQFLFTQVCMLVKEEDLFYMTHSILGMEDHFGT